MYYKVDMEAMPQATCVPHNSSNQTQRHLDANAGCLNGHTHTRKSQYNVIKVCRDECCQELNIEYTHKHTHTYVHTYIDSYIDRKTSATFNQFQMYTIFFLLGFCGKSLKTGWEMGSKDCAIVKTYIHMYNQIHIHWYYNGKSYSISWQICCQI